MMLQINTEFLVAREPLGSEAPRCESSEALAEPSQGQVCRPSPVARRYPQQTLAADQGELVGNPMWQAVLRA
jgi:hypothetical protein